MNLQQRIAGKLPQIDIVGTIFFVDIRLRELRADFGLKSRIGLDKLENGPDVESYRFAFNTETKQLVEIERNITEWPGHILIVEIPGNTQLDPYAVALENSVDPVAFVEIHPFDRELKARVIPLSETEIPKMIKRNRLAKEQRLLTKSARKGTKKSSSSL
jgi:hypothetical protein